MFVVANIPAKKLNIAPHKTLNFDFINLAIFKYSTLYCYYFILYF